MDILFWSGGKDSYLALELYREKNADNKNIRLLTTFEKTTGLVPHQNIPLDHIQKQADKLELTLITVPLPQKCPNDIYLARVKKAIHKQKIPVKHLVFGDWYLQEIREWRERAFGEMGYDCLFPIWEKSLHTLLPILMLKPIDVKITAVKEEFQRYIRVGELYNQKFVQTLPGEIDPMGENGEFHTEVIFKDLKKEVI